MSKLEDMKEEIKLNVPPEGYHELTNYMEDMADRYECSITIARQALREFKKEVPENMTLHQYMKSTYYSRESVDMIRLGIYGVLIKDRINEPIPDDTTFYNNTIPGIISKIQKHYGVDKDDIEAAISSIILSAEKY